MSNYNAHLASIADASSNAAVLSPLSTSNAWIGDEESSSTLDFSWIDGSTWSYTNWAPGEPNYPGTETCTEIYASNGTWDSLTCSTTLGAICEISP